MADNQQWKIDLLIMLAKDDNTDAIYFWVREEQLRISVLCNDTFYWATGDGEEVTGPEDVADLAAVRAEARSKVIIPGSRQINHWLTDEWPILWVCRKRQMRPQRPWWQRIPEESPARALFLATGPPRDPHSEG